VPSWFIVVREPAALFVFGSDSAGLWIVALWQKTLPVVELLKGGNERSLEVGDGEQYQRFDEHHQYGVGGFC